MRIATVPIRKDGSPGVPVPGPETGSFICNDCGQKFMWHPGSSKLAWPSGCANCDSTNITRV